MKDPVLLFKITNPHYNIKYHEYTIYMDLQLQI